MRFGSTRQPSLGIIIVRMPVPGHSIIEVKVEIVSPNIPMLIGLDTLDKFGIYVNNIQNLLVHDKIKWGIPLIRKGGHMYYNWANEILFTMEELRRMHRGFYHPDNDKLYNLIKKAKPEDATPGTMRTIEAISSQCTTFQYHSPRPLRFSATIPGVIMFNRLLIIDQMWIQKRPILNVVDVDTRYSAASFLDGESTEDVGEPSLLCWVSTYMGYPDIVKGDSGSVFTSRKWNKLADNVGVAIEITPVESSNSTGVGERIHDPLRRIYHKIHRDHPGHRKELILALAAKAMNDTIGPEGLVPSLLVFRTIPRVSYETIGLPDQEERMGMMQTARDEMERITARLRNIAYSTQVALAKGCTCDALRRRSRPSTESEK